MEGDSMLQQPAGWYRDPAPRDSTAPDTWRFWDGTSWTAQTRTGTKKERQEWRDEAAAARLVHVQDLAFRAEAGDLEAQWELAAASAAPQGSRTSDGHRLAGWWARFAAALLDGTVITVLGCLVAWPFLRQVGTAYGELVAASVRAAQSGEALPPTEVFLERVAGPLLATTVIVLLVNAVYEIGLLKGCQATLGKMVLGLQVRPHDQLGPLTWRAAVLRWSGKGGVGALQWVPFGMVLYAVYYLLDHLWPLGDRNRQALHDKLARTYVVRKA